MIEDQEQATTEGPELPVYLDHHATTPCDPRVVAAMVPCFREVYGNPSSHQHSFGRAAHDRVEAARQQVADLLGCDAAEVVFTSGATEANNLAIKGVVEATGGGRGHLVTAVTEHKAVLDVVSRLERQGLEVTYLGVQEDGRVDPNAVSEALRDDTILVTLMLANNEIGVLHSIAEIARRCRQRGVLLHCDAAQALATEDCDVEALGVDLMSLSAHKAYGPKGIGALYLRRRRPRVRLAAQMDGGGHERNRRSGTLNVPGIVGFGEACALVAEDRETEAERLIRLRDRLLGHLQSHRPDLQVHGSLDHRLPNNLNVSFPGVAADDLAASITTVALSSGAACSAPGSDGSYVLKALPGADGELGSLRFGLGRGTTAEEVDFAAGEVLAAVAAYESLPTVERCAAAC